ncbi:MAG: hypothetical protein QOJ53_2352 [Sphingomonadales bacterium]|jgi:hypothetical protein|nr:hypothetical protein [Sphingomonadales bacterium]MEA3048020.1 hypothetical protein [Sphingomonadales bacterium]
MPARLASSVLVGGLLRRAESEGGFGAVIARGDPTAGAIAVILAEKGRKACFLERLLQPDGSYAWQSARQEIENEQEFEKFLERRRNFDPDLWILELDIASAERFAAEMNAAG